MFKEDGENVSVVSVYEKKKIIQEQKSFHYLYITNFQQLYITENAVECFL